MEQFYPKMKMLCRATKGISVFFIALLFASAAFAQAPVITSFSPTYGLSGTTVTIKGSHFTGASDIRFGSLSSYVTQVFGDTMITAVVGNGATGPVTVVTLQGSTSSGTFRYSATPPTKILSFSPVTGGLGTTLTIQGRSFTGAIVSVAGYGVAATVVSDSVITTTLGPGHGSGPVIVTTYQGGTDSLAGFTYSTVLPTAILSFSPTSARPGAIVTIKGRGFTNPVVVTFGKAPAPTNGVVAVSDSVVTAVVPLNAQSGKVAFIGQFGADSVDGFTLIPTAPEKVISFSPAGGTTGTAITISGTGFTGATSVKFGNIAAASFTVTNDSTINAVVGAGATGYVTVKTTVSADSLNGFTYTPPLVPGPKISSFSPASAFMGTYVAIKGTHFSGATFVYFGGVQAGAFILNSDTLITALTGTGATGSIRVQTPYGSDSLGGFVYKKIATINSFTPASGATGTIVSITGTNLSTVTAVAFGRTAAASFTIVSDSLLTAVVGAGASGYVMITNPYYQDSLPGFTYTIRPYTRVTGFAPSSGTTGTTVTISGYSFTGATAVRFGGKAAASFSILSDSAIRAVVGTGASGSISVSGPFGADSLAGFTYTSPSPAPKIYSFSPTSAATGTTVSINGAHLTGATNIGFGGIAAASFIVVNDSLIKAIVASGRTGYVSVATPSGIDTLIGFTYIPPVSSAPKVLSFTPANGTTGTSVSIYGTHFTGATAVRFGGRNATSFTVITDSSTTAFVGTGATGSVSVTTPSGSDSLAGFTYVPPVGSAAKVLSFTPTSGSSGTQVHIYGTHFTNTTSVRFGGINAALITVNNDSTITAVVGTGATGSISVTTPNGTDSLAGFTYIAPPVNAPPKVLAFTPGSGAAGTVVVVYGLHFTGATAVSFGGVRTDSFTVVSDSIISAIVSTGASGYTAVFTPYGADSLGGFIYNSAGRQAIAVYPNPAYGYTILKHPVSSNSSQVQVLDMQGTILKSVTLPPNATATTRIALTGLTRGIYKITWTDGRSSMHQTVFVP